MNNRLPWHDTLWQQVQRSCQQDRLPHALLLCGPLGMGKALFAQHLAENLLCEKSPLHTEDKGRKSVSSHDGGVPPFEKGGGGISASTCGHCKSCYLLRAKTHPDLLNVQPAETGKQISIDQIRSLIQFYTLTANYGRYQIAIVAPAEAMTRNAANSLLKLLEEPPPKTLIMLVSHQPSALLATILSRCQRLDFGSPNRTGAQTWLRSRLNEKKRVTEDYVQLLLNLSTQAPLAALALVETEGMAKRQALFDSLTQLPSGQIDPVRVAEGWSKLEAAPVLQWMLSWTMDIIRYATTGHTQYLVNYDHQEALQRLAKQLNLRRLFEILDLQQEAYWLVTGSANIKPQGLLESIAIAWVKLGAQHHRR